MTITAKFTSICPVCNVRITPGTKVEWSRGSQARHVACTAAAPAARAARSTAYTGPAYRARVGGSAPLVAGYSSWCTGREGCRCYDCE